jgi:hypothetical protein
MVRDALAYASRIYPTCAHRFGSRVNPTSADAPHHEDEYADAIFKQRIDAGTPMHPARPRGRKVEGRERCETQRSSFVFLLRGTCRLAALCFGVFLTTRGRAFREGKIAGAPRSTGVSSGLAFPRQPGSWQAVLVPPGGAPTPPRCLAANQPRRRRPFPATRTPLDAPSMETTSRNIVLVAGESQEKDFPSCAGLTRASSSTRFTFLDGRVFARP